MGHERCFCDLTLECPDRSKGEELSASKCGPVRTRKQTSADRLVMSQRANRRHDPLPTPPLTVVACWRTATGTSGSTLAKQMKQAVLIRRAPYASRHHRRHTGRANRRGRDFGGTAPTQFARRPFPSAQIRGAQRGPEGG